MPTAAEIFQNMPAKFNPEGAGNWETVIQFNVSGEGGGTWTLEVKGGKCTTCETSVTKVDLCIKTSYVPTCHPAKASTKPIT